MKKNNPANRRKFLEVLTAGAATLGITTFSAPFQGLQAAAKNIPAGNDPDAWFAKIKGKHRVVFDVTQPHAIFPFAWPRVFLMTNVATGTPEKENSVVVVLRHHAVGYAMEDALWSKYNFGEMFKAPDPATSQAATRNPFWNPAKGAYKIPGIGEVQIGINELQQSGVMFCVCEAALTVNSAAAAGKINAKPADVLAEWKAGLLPGIQLVPSGVWALGRAQEKGCGYIFAG